ncbi:MAG TPA: hypothetical protein VJP77_02850, partial [Planctomycetota bacterium]|nr:hypothetical protein [Planctomycetota bacterium]
VAGGVQVFVRLGGDIDLAKLGETLARRADKLRGTLGAGQQKLANEGFLRNADPELVAAERERLVELGRELALLESNLAL